jgi:hypothetical protein
MTDTYQNILDGKYENRIEYSRAPEVRKLYYKERVLLERLFKEDLEKEFGVESNPKKDMLYSRAYERGHSSGFNEIAGVYADLVDLIR